MQRFWRSRSWRSVLALLPLFVPWLVCGFCALLSPEQLASDRGLKPSADWSRSLRIGELYGTDGPSLVTDRQNHVHLIWTMRAGEKEYGLHYAGLDDLGLVEEDHDLNTGLLYPRRPRLLLGEDGSLHGFVLALSEPGATSGLFHLSLTADGRLDSGPTLLSSPDRPVYFYDVVAGPRGASHIFWTEGGVPNSDLFYSTLGADERPKLMLHSASHPAVSMDTDGDIHLLWSQEGGTRDEIEIYYASPEDIVAGPVAGIRLLELDREEILYMTWPVLGLDLEHAYAIWVVEPAQTYGEPFREVWYTSIGLDEEQPGSVEKFVFPVEEYPDYISHEAPYAYDHIVSLLPPPESGTAMIDMPSPLPEQAAEVPVAFSAVIQRGAGMEAQILVGIFSEGRLLGYQQACKTTHWSRVPNLASDSNGNLHLSWAEGLEPGPSDVYYASTSPLVKERLDRLTSQDLVLGLLNTLFGAAAGIVMVPLVVLWLIPSVVWVAISGRFIAEEGMQGRKGRWALAISLVTYLITKVYLTPSVLSYVPLSASMPFLPSSMEMLLRVGVPLLTTGAGVGAVIYVVRRVKTRSLLLSSLAFMLVDGLLTVAVYGPGIVGQQ